jgi:hypothetical protein
VAAMNCSTTISKSMQRLNLAIIERYLPMSVRIQSEVARHRRYEKGSAVPANFDWGVWYWGGFPTLTLPFLDFLSRLAPVNHFFWRGDDFASKLRSAIHAGFISSWFGGKLLAMLWSYSMSLWLNSFLVQPAKAVRSPPLVSVLHFCTLSSFKSK